MGVDSFQFQLQVVFDYRFITILVMGCTSRIVKHLPRRADPKESAHGRRSGLIGPGNTLSSTRRILTPDTLRHKTTSGELRRRGGRALAEDGMS